MTIAQAIHHLPPGYQVSIRNGNPCPEGLASTPEWTGVTTEYYHGTTAHNLLRGIIRDGLKPTYGAGEDATATAWGVRTPMVYLSNNIESACYYPFHDSMTATDKFKDHGKPIGGEIISRDGGPAVCAQKRSH